MEDLHVEEKTPLAPPSALYASRAPVSPNPNIAARLAVGYRLDEIDNDITGVTPACFEPTIDYVVVKWPRFAFEKFPGVDPTLTTHMKSVGEAMAIGRTFQQAFAKALRSRELDKAPCLAEADEQALLESLRTPGAARFETVLELLRRGAAVRALHERTSIDPWFLEELQQLAQRPDAPF